jgi:hypothetical protein
MSAPTGDLSGWAEAVASARQAREVLRDEDIRGDLSRRVETVLSTLEREREEARADVPGCIASLRRYHRHEIVPPGTVDLRGPKDPSPLPRPDLVRDGTWPSPDFAGFTILRSSMYFDLSEWKPIPAGTTPENAGRVEPAHTTRVIDLIRKKNVTQDNSRLFLQQRTEGFEIDARCVGRGYAVRGSLGREQLGGGTEPVLVREIAVDLSDVAPGKEVRVAIDETTWNGFQYNARGKQWAAMLAPDDLSEMELAVRFPAGRKPTTPPALYIFQKGSPNLVVPAHTQSFTNPIDQDWWIWRPRDIRKDYVYKIEWDWAPAPNPQPPSPTS